MSEAAASPEEERAVITEAFALVRRYSDPRVHVLLGDLERIMRAESRVRQIAGLRSQILGAAFACDPDESAGLAEVYELDKHSRRVKGVPS